MQNRVNHTYVKRASAQDMSRIALAVAFPSAVFFLCIYSISRFKGFGTYLMGPAIAIMWLAGSGVSWWMPSHRKDTIKETLVTITCYCGALLLFHMLIGITSGVSSEMLMATFNQPMATATANAIPGYLQNALYMVSVMVPLSFLGMQFKRVLQFRRNQNKQKILSQLRSVRGPKGSGPN